jgi:CRISPR-associated protein Csx10
MLTEHAENHAWLIYFLELQRKGKTVRYDDILSREKIVETFTEVRQQTAIEENGVAKDTSLRTIRVLKRGLTFSGTVSFGNEADHEDLLITLLLACANFRAFGTKRNRGFGEVQCTLWEAETGKTLSIQERWKEIENYVPATI